MSPLEGTSRCPGVDAAAGAGAGVLAFVDAGVDSDPAVLAPPPPPPPVPPAPAAPVAEVDVDVVDGKPKSNPDPGAAADVVVVDDDETWEGDPNEKPMLPAFGGVDLSLLPPGATPNPNDAGLVVVVDAAAPPNVNGDDFVGKPNGFVGGPPNALPGCCSGGNGSAWPFFSLSEADFVVAAPNILLEPPVVVSPNKFEPGAKLKAKGAGADEADLSFSLSFSSRVELKSDAVFGGLLKSKVLVAPLPPPPKGKDADSFVARDVAGLN